MRTEEITDLLFQYLGKLLYEPEKAELDVEALPKEFHGVGKGLVYFASMLNDLRDFSYELGRGNLAAKPPSGNELVSPLKSLHASLKHLTWQAQRIAQGDYKQRVDFLGDFASAFNQMVIQLDERRMALMDEIEAGRKKTNALEQSIRMFEAITLNIPQWIMVLDIASSDTLFINQTVLGVFEVNPILASDLQEWMERQIEQMSSPEDPENMHVLDAEFSTEGKRWSLSVSTYPLVWHNRQAIAFIFTDLSDERAQLQKLEHIAYQDALTGVTSRYHGLSILDEWIAAHEDFCICFVDMDSLKYVNDVFGHAAGDDYIISVANILGRFSADALVSRLGGDEFMLLQKNWSEPQAEERMKVLRDELARQSVAEDAYTRSMSYGIVHVPRDNTVSASDLLSAADDRMYRFKRAHKANRQ